MSSTKRCSDVSVLSVGWIGGAKRRRTKSPARVTSDSAPDLGSGSPLIQPAAANSVVAMHTIPQNAAPEDWDAKLIGHGIVSKLKNAMKVLLKGCGLCPSLKEAVKVLLEIVDSIETIGRNNQIFHEASSELLQWAVILSKYLSQPQLQPEIMSKRINDLTEVLKQQAENMADSLRRNALRRLIQSEKDLECLQKCYRAIEISFSQLQVDASLNTWILADEALKNSRLEGLAPSHSARYDSAFSNKIQRGACYPNTCAALLEGLLCRVYGSDQMIEYIFGMAGTGKTSIAYSICAELERSARLGANFFCCRASPECEDIGRIIPTIAYQLAHRFYPFKSALCRILGETPNLAQRNIETQFEYLIKMPLLEIEDILPKHFVVVIDGLEECLDSRTTGRLLDLLFQYTPILPIKFLLTSRPEPAITHPNLTNEKLCHTFYLHHLDKQRAQEDIETVLSVMLSCFRLSKGDLKRLAEQCGGLFAYAVTLARHILSTEPGADPLRRLAAALDRDPTRSPMGYGEMDKLYNDILGPLLVHEKVSGDRAAEVQGMQQAFWTVLCAREGLPKATLVALTGCTQAWSALQWFRSVLHISEDEGTVSIIHASLPEFVFSAERSGPLTCNEQAQHALLARKCFDLMKEGLEFNHGRFATLGVFDKDVPQLQSTLQETIPPELSYACRHWAEHLKRSGPCKELLACLRNFLGEGLLYWVEVLNLKGWINYAQSALMSAQNWAAHAHGEALDEVLKFLHDAGNFVTMFAANPVCRSTLHIYTSLAFVPRDSEVWRHYSTRIDSPMQVGGTIMSQRRGAALATTVVGAGVTALAHSPDGMLIAAGTTDGEIHLSYAYNGAQLLQPFKAHSNAVNSLAFSPGGDFMVSGSQDCTVAVWTFSAHTQLPELQVRLQGHELPVNSVAIAPDCTRFASASDDKSIRLWDPHDYTIPAQLLEGHDSSVTSIQISPDSTKLASASQDLTVRVWDLSTLAQLGDSLQGHTDVVTSVIFSVDGKYVISGSLDCTIRAWHTQHSLQLYGPLKGHSGGINSLALSSDGKRIVSGGQDRTFLMWNTYNGHQIAGPFDGHTGDITSLIFSPDSAHVVSGSLDCAVKTWDARHSTIFPQLPQGHANGITSVASSTDGTLIASGSRDHTINIWASSDGSLSSGPLVGHESLVTSIAFSNDDAYPRLASGSQDCTVRIWTLETGTPLFDPIEHNSGVNSVAFSPNDTLIASGCDDQAVRLWNSRNGAAIGNPLRGHENSVTSLAFSRDGRLLVSGSWDQTISIWDVLDGTRMAGPLHGHTDAVTSVLFSPEHHLVMSGSWDRKIHVWRWADGTPLAATFEGHTDGITSLALSADGTCLVSGSSDGQIRVWSIPSGRLLTAPLDSHSDHVTSVAFLPNEMRIVSGSLDRTVRVWQIPGSNEQRVWAVDQSGWITGQDSSLVAYPPADLRDIIPLPPNILTIYPHGSVTLSLRDVHLELRRPHLSV